MISAQTLEHRSEKVKERWHQYLEVQSEREQLNPHPSHGVDDDPDRGDGHSDSDDDNPESNVSFAKLSANSMITAQRWPWTQLVELTTDRKYYRNEIENTFQFNPPKEFEKETEGNNDSYASRSLESEHESTSISQKFQKRRLGVVNSSQGMEKNASNRQGGTYLSSLNLENSNIFLREKFNTELQSRRQYLKSNNFNNEKVMPGYGDSGSGDEDDDEEEKKERKIKRHLAAFDPPPNAPLDSLTNSSDYWKEVSSLRKKVSQDVSSPWYDAHVLLQRLRRFDDMKSFLEQYKEMQLKRAAASSGRGGGNNHPKGKRYQYESGEDLDIDIPLLFDFFSS